MSESSQAAEQMTKTSIQISEAAAKLAAQGAKHLAALLFALARDQKKTKGKTSLMRLLKEERPLKVFQIKQEDLPRFAQEARQYGVLYAAVMDKASESGLCDLLARAEDVSKVNRIFQRMGYAAPAKDGDKKNAAPRAPQNSLLSERGNGLTAPETQASDKVPVRPKMAAMQAAAKRMRTAQVQVKTAGEIVPGR